MKVITIFSLALFICLGPLAAHSQEEKVRFTPGGEDLLKKQIEAIGFIDGTLRDQALELLKLMDDFDIPESEEGDEYAIRLIRKSRRVFHYLENYQWLNGPDSFHEHAQPPISWLFQEVRKKLDRAPLEEAPKKYFQRLYDLIVSGEPIPRGKDMLEAEVAPC